MPNAFDFSNPPFDRLTADEAAAFRAALDVGYFRPDETIAAAGAPVESLFVVIKGAVEERDGKELIALLGPKDSFDTRAIVEGTSAHFFIAREETLAYLAPKDLTLKLMRENARFGSFFYLDISRKLEAVAQAQEEVRSGSLMRTRIGDLFLHPAVFVDSSVTIEFAGHKMREIDSNTLFVRDGARTGIITGMNLAKAAVLKGMKIDEPVAPVVHYDMVALDEDDFVFMALLEMTKSNKRRVAVKRGEEFIGVLEDIDLLGFLAGNAQVIAGRIDRAASMADLRIAAREILDQIRVLRRQNVRVEVIAEIVSDLNRRLMARTFGLLAPPELQAQSCLIVMGSEGRGEQTMRTDQDNGLILAGPFDEAVLNDFRRAFTVALEEYGFPPCPGEVMVRNPLWSKPLADYVDDFRRWIALPDENAHMNVAIFYDAAAVAGRIELLTEAKHALIASVRNEKAYLARFAHAVEAFETPIGFFNNLIASESGGALDLKKGGLFPIVHGVRSLALEHGLSETSTDARITRLAEAGIFSEDFARDLKQSFYYLMRMRLDAQLEEEKGGGALVKPAELSSIERDLLREAFKVVKAFREILRRHFNLGMF